MHNLFTNLSEYIAEKSASKPDFREFEYTSFWEAFFEDSFAGISFEVRKNCTPGKSYNCKNVCIPISKNCLNPIAGQAKNYAEWLQLNNSTDKKSKKPTEDDELNSLVEEIFREKMDDFKNLSRYVMLPNGKKYDDILKKDGKEAADKAYEEFAKESALELALEIQQSKLIDKERESINNGKDEKLKRELAAKDRLYPETRIQSTLEEFKKNNPKINLIAELEKEEELDKRLSYDSIMSRGREMTRRLEQELAEAKTFEEKVAVMSAYRSSLLKSGMPEKEAIALAESKKYESSISPYEKDIVKASSTEFFMLTGGMGSTTLNKFEKSSDRAHADKNNRSVNIGFIPEHHTVFHEMGHHIEFSETRIASAAIEWRDKRATGGQQKLKDLIPGSSYREDEVAKVGDYIHPYVGKVYSTKTTEVLSMGIERFSDAESMVDLYEQDKEHFQFVLGVIRA